MKTVRKLRRLAAFLMTLFLLTGEFYGAGFAAYAADDAEDEIAASEDAEAAADDEAAEADEASDEAADDEADPASGEDVSDGEEESDEAAPKILIGGIDLASLSSAQISKLRERGISYQNGVLALNNVDLSEINADVAIESSGDLMLVIMGDCKIGGKRGESNLQFTGIKTKGDLTIAGLGIGQKVVGKTGMIGIDGKLTIAPATPINRVSSLGIDCGGNLIIGGSLVMPEESLGNSYEYVSAMTQKLTLVCAGKDQTLRGDKVPAIHAEGSISVVGKKTEVNATSTGVAISAGESINLQDCIIAEPGKGVIGTKNGFTTVLSGGEMAAAVKIVSGEQYDLWICGTRVNSYNCSDLSACFKEGTASYDPVTGTLTLDGAQNKDYNGVVIDTSNSLKIRGNGQISGSGSNGRAVMMYSDKADDILLDIEGKFEFSGMQALYCPGNGHSIRIGGSDTEVTALSNGEYAIKTGKDFILDEGTVTAKSTAENGNAVESAMIRLNYGTLNAETDEEKGGAALFAYRENGIVLGEGMEVLEPAGAAPGTITTAADKKVTVLLNGEEVVKKATIASSYHKLDLTQAGTVYGTALPDPVFVPVEGASDPVLSYSGILKKDGSAYGPAAEAPTLPGNYQVVVTQTKGEESYRGSAAFEILPKEITVSAEPEKAEFVFTGDAYVRLKNVELVGVIGTDDVKVDGDGTYGDSDDEIFGEMDDENAGIDKPVKALADWTELAGADASNYKLDLKLTGIKVTVTKAPRNDSEVTYHVEEGKSYSETLPLFFDYDESIDPNVVVKEGDDQLDGTVTVTGIVLSWKMKSELTADVVLEITVKGGTNYEDYKLTVTLKRPHICADNLEKVEAKAPGCVEYGYEEHYECTICGKLYEDAEGTKEITDPTVLLIDALGHDWDNGVITVPPTKGSKGTMLYTCARCGATKTESVNYHHSGLDPIPEQLESCTELYLVKGQKFNLPASEGNWVLADKKAGKKYLSVSKKGAVNAKKETSDPVVISNDASGRTISVKICKPVIDKKASNLKLDAGTGGVIALTGVDTHLNVYWYSAKPDVVTVDESGHINAVSKGVAKITAYVNGKAFTASVKVSEPALAVTRTLYMNVGSSKTLSLKGIKAWKSADETIATTKNKKGQYTNKISALSANKVQLTASANGIDYTVDLIVEDISLKNSELAGKGKNNYTLELTEGAFYALDFAYVQQELSFKSSKPAVAFANEDGVIEARAEGKSKITTKINGKTVTVTVTVKKPAP